MCMAGERNQWHWAREKVVRNESWEQRSEEDLIPFQGKCPLPFPL